MKYTIRPLSDHTIPGPFEISRFRADLDDTRRLIARELEFLGATSYVLELDVREGDIRNDGALRSDARTPNSGACRIAFDSDKGPMVFGTNNYYTYSRRSDWSQNLRAIGMTLESLRAVERYGVIREGEQYRGMLQIEAGIGIGASHLTKFAAELRVWEAAGSPPHLSPGSWRRLVKQAKIRAHPDRNNGEHRPWNELAEALELLGRDG